PRSTDLSGFSVHGLRPDDHGLRGSGDRRHRLDLGRDRHGLHPWPCRGDHQGLLPGSCNHGRLRRHDRRPAPEAEWHLFLGESVMSKTSVIAIALLAVALVAPLFVYPVTLMTILCFIVFACSFNLLLGYTGLLCFGHAMFFGSAAYVAGWLMKTYGLTPEMGILAGGLFSAALGLLVGIIAVRKSGITFAMITFAIAQFVYFILLRSPFTGGEDGLQKIPREPVLGLIDVTRNFNYYYVVLAITVLAVFFFYRIVHSPFGEILKAIRDNDARVESLGMKPERYKLMALVLSAGLAGVAGAMKASVFQFATLTDVSFPIS